MNIFVFIAVVSFVCSVIGLVLQLVLLKIPKFQKLIWVFVIFIMTFITGMAAYYHGEAIRIDDIHCKAEAISGHYNGSSLNKEFIQESLTFLEENKDRYPDAYERAKDIYEDMRSLDFRHDYEPAMEIHGIIKGIATLNE